MKSPHKRLTIARKRRTRRSLTISQLRRAQNEAKQQREYEAMVAAFKLARPELLAKSSS